MLTRIFIIMKWVKKVDARESITGSHERTYDPPQTHQDLRQLPW